jgi:TolB protein
MAKASPIYLSANDGHIYRVKLRGGEASRITSEDGYFHFLHGVSPDGQELAYVAIENSDFSTPGQVMTMPANGGSSTWICVGQEHCDGPEYSPDGEWLYLNTEAFTSRPGHAQIARLRANGTGLERLTENESVDWFPHISPDGHLANYLRYPQGP